MAEGNVHRASALLVLLVGRPTNTSSRAQYIQAGAIAPVLSHSPAEPAAVAGAKCAVRHLSAGCQRWGRPSLIELCNLLPLPALACCILKLAPEQQQVAALIPTSTAPSNPAAGRYAVDAFRSRQLGEGELMQVLDAGTVRVSASGRCVLRSNRS